MKNWLLALVMCAGLAACGSSVKLDDVPVEDKSGTSVTLAGRDSAGSGTAGSAGATGQTAVKPVELGGPGSGGAGPSGPRLIYFDFDSYVVKPEFQSVIEAQARYVRADKGRKMAVEGHTDERGGREYNLALGQKRAEAVRQALGLLGVADAQIEAVSFGKEKPAVEGGDEGAMAKNRRAEIVYK
jgi:peptidoglycan-associated lipoprotein